MIAILLALAWLLGIVAAAWTDADPAAALAACGLLGAATFAWRPRPSTLMALPFACALIVLATARYDATVPHPATALAANNGGDEVKLQGVVNDEPRLDGSAILYRVSVESVDGLPASGNALMRLPAYSEYEYGDRLEAKGDLDEPPVFDAFDYREYLLRQGVTSLMSYPEVQLVDTGNGSPWHARVIDVRTDLSEALSDALPEPQVSLAAGVLFGAKSGMPSDLRESMAATGTSHLVAVSGQNVTILAGLVIAAFAWIIGRRPASWLALGMIAGYTLLVGFDASIVRAAIMGSLFVIATATGRQNATLIALGYAAAIMTALDPQIVHDVGFQLSFAATLGLVILSPIIREQLESAAVRFGGGRVPAMRGLIETLAVTLAAIAATLPISAITFDRVSLVAPVANLFTVPAFVAVAATSAVAAVMTLAIPSSATIAGFIAYPAAAYMTSAIDFFASVPAASVHVSGITIWHALIWYAALGATCYWYRRRSRVLEDDAPQLRAIPARRLVPTVGVATVAVIAIALGSTALPDSGNERLAVTFLDVGQGDAILVEDAAGHRVLIDGGPAGQGIDAALSRQLPFYDRRIDLVVLTHPDADHVGGLLQVLSDYDVRSVLNAAGSSDTELYDRWVVTLDAAGLNATTADAGERIVLDGAVMQVLAPDAEDVLLPTEALNDTSTVVRLDTGEVSFLFAGDIGQQGEIALIRSGADLNATVLKVGHHGSKSSSSEEFLAAVSPSLSVISVGADNRYGHPAAETLGRLAGEPVLRTDEEGDITVSTDGTRVWVETQR